MKTNILFPPRWMGLKGFLNLNNHFQLRIISSYIKNCKGIVRVGCVKFLYHRRQFRDLYQIIMRFNLTNLYLVGASFARDCVSEVASKTRSYKKSVVVGLPFIVKYVASEARSYKKIIRVRKLSNNRIISLN